MNDGMPKIKNVKKKLLRASFLRAIINFSQLNNLVGHRYITLLKDA